MNIKEFATMANCEVGFIIDELTSFNPAFRWKATSEIPEELKKDLMARVDFYPESESQSSEQQSSTPRPSIKRADPATLQEAIAQRRENSETIKLALLDALNNQHIAYIVELAIKNALNLVDTYDDVQIKVLHQDIAQRNIKIQAQIEALRLENQTQQIARTNESAQLMGKSVVTQSESQKSLQESMDVFNIVMQAIA